ncbi:MAG: HTTM domain-containing protein [Pseudobdellovibrionaceae bacterium]
MIRSLWQKWNQFWFDPVPLFNLAAFRILFCFTMASMYLGRQMDVELFYTDAGILPKDLALKVLPESYRPFAVYSFWPDSWVFAIHAVFVLILFLMAFGVFSRWLGFIATFFQLAFLYRNYGVAFGADQIGSLFLFYLAFTQSDARLSFRHWWRKKRQKSELSGDLLTSVFYRMIQIQLCLVYVYSGMEKLKGSTWWDGTAIWSVLANSQMVIGDFTWTRHFPLLIVFLSFSTLLFELYFPVLVWVQSLRKYLLMAGVLFHAGIGIFMALWSFALLMVSPYILFLSEESLLKFMEKCRHCWLRLKMRQS